LHGTLFAIVHLLPKTIVSEKNLTELEWKKFSKGKKFEDKDFIKALAALEAGQRSKDVAAQQKALDDIEKQAGKLRSANKADKDLLRYLDDAESELPGQRKLLEIEAKKAAARQAAQAGEEGDAEGPAALTSKMLPLLRQVPKGDVVLQAMVASAGKEVSVLVSLRAAGAPQKKLLLEELGVSSGAKFMQGECIWEANAHTFVLEAKVANLARSIKAALMKQTGQRFKVRVRGADPNDVDEDGEEQEGAQVQSQEESAEQARYLARLGELKPRIDAAIRDLVGDAPRIKALDTFAAAKAAEGNYPAGLQALEAVAKLLGNGSGSGGASGSNGGGAAAPGGESPEHQELMAAMTRLTPMIQQAVAAHPERRQELLGALAGFQRMMAGTQYAQAKEALVQVGRLLQALKTEAGAASRPAPGAARPAKVPAHPLMPIWDTASENVVDQAGTLIAALRRFRDAELDRMADDLVQTLNALLADVDEALEEYDRLDGSERAANAAEARDFLRSQQREVASDRLIRAADHNPLELKLNIAATLDKALDEIAAAFEG
jgi:hypothetical protein